MLKYFHKAQHPSNADLKKAETRAAFLSESSRLLSKSVEKELNLEPLLEGAVPKFCDLILIELYGEDPELPTFQANKAVPSLHDHLEPLRNSIHERRAYTESLNLGSFMVAPIFVYGKSHGSVSIGLVGSKPRYTSDDLKMLEDLARLIGMAAAHANLYRQAQEAIRSRDEFLSIASHELKTPLTPLKLQTQGLMRNLRAGTLASLSPERLKKMLETSERQISRLVKLVDDLLEISRISSGKLDLTVSEFDIIDLIHEVTERFSEQITSSGSVLHLTLPEFQTVRWDPFRIEQVLVNLLTNAIRYGDGKKIEVHCVRIEEVVRISFRDYGIGIARLDQVRVFGRFERAVSGSHFGGLGLGLYIVSQIIESHQGKITLESDIGQGSTFTIDLPLASTEPSATGTYSPQYLG